MTGECDAMVAFQNQFINRQSELVSAIRMLARDVNHLPFPVQLKLLKKIKGSFREMKAQVNYERAAFVF